jgi:hypothetical protein
MENKGVGDITENELSERSVDLMCVCIVCFVWTLTVISL